MVNRNTFREAFTEIDAETSDYYVLGFYSSNPDETRRTRQLRIEVARDGAQVRSRTHYLLPFPDAPPARRRPGRRPSRRRKHPEWCGSRGPPRQRRATATAATPYCRKRYEIFVKIARLVRR